MASNKSSMSRTPETAPPVVPELGQDASEKPAEVVPARGKKHALPPGVQMHDAGVSPMATKPIPEPAEPDPKKPPTGWAGSYRTCGGCGDFLGNEKFCKKCSPHRFPSNVSMSALPKVEAK